MVVEKLRRAYLKVQLLLVDKSLPAATNEDIDQINKLRDDFRKFPVFDVMNSAQSLAEWQINLNELRQCILTKNPREFLRFPVILRTMFVDKPNYVRFELSHLQRQTNWQTTWCDLLEESKIGRPLPYLHYPQSSGNLIHSGFHVAKFIEATGCATNWPALIFEFGGGYGSLCRVFYKLGFKGKYIIFDFPQFSALQRYYLRGLGIRVYEDTTQFKRAETGVFCVAELSQLRDLMSEVPLKSLFTATWSLSEAPQNIRNDIEPLAKKCGAFLLAYQDRFNEMDNRSYFNLWVELLKNKIEWTHETIGHIPGNNYLFGAPSP